MSAKGPSQRARDSQTPWGFLSTLGYDLRSQEVSPWPRPCHLFSLSCPFQNRSLSLSLLGLRSPLPLALALTYLSPAPPEVCQHQPHYCHHSPRTHILSLHAHTCMQGLPLSKALSSVIFQPHLSPGGWRVVRQAMIWLYWSPFPLHFVPRGMQADLGGFFGILLFMFSSLV